MTEAEVMKLKAGDKIVIIRTQRPEASLLNLLEGTVLTVKGLVPYGPYGPYLVDVVVDNELREKLTAVTTNDQSNCQTLHLYSWCISLVEKPKNLHYPHICPKCNNPAYFGAVPAAFECSMRCGR